MKYDSVLLPLPRAGEGWGEGARRAQIFVGRAPRAHQISAKPPTKQDNAVVGRGCLPYKVLWFIGRQQKREPRRPLCNAISVLFAVSAITWAGALFGTTQPPSPAEIDRLRMHADAGRDDRALDMLLVAARTGNADAQRAAGEAILNRADQTRAPEGMQWLERAAAQNDTRAMILLGKAWLFGASGSTAAATSARMPDAIKARRWFERAQPSVNPQAAYYLGLIEKSGYGRPANPAAAADFFRVAAQQNMPEAMYLLGNAYASGEGVDADPREAMRWYLRAASLEHPQATQELSQAFARGDTLLPQSDFQAQQMRRAVEHALRHPRALP